jgi:hypothetical protein
MHRAPSAYRDAVHGWLKLVVDVQPVPYTHLMPPQLVDCLAQPAYAVFEKVEHTVPVHTPRLQ